MSNNTPKRQKTEHLPLAPPLQATTNTGAQDCKNDRSSIAGTVHGPVSTDNSQRYCVNIKDAFFIDSAAALSKLMENNGSFKNFIELTHLANEGGHIQPVESSSSSLKTSWEQSQEVDSVLRYGTSGKQQASFTNPDEQLYPQESSKDDSDGSTDDCDGDQITDEQLHEMIVCDSSENDADIQEISDDFVYSMVIKHKNKASKHAAELNIEVREKGAGILPEDMSVISKQNDTGKPENIVSRSADECDAKHPFKRETETESKLKSNLRVDQTCYLLFKIDLRDITEPRFRIVTKENIIKTVDIAQYRPYVTDKVSSFLDQVLQETHNLDKEGDKNSSKNMNKVKYLRRVFKFDPMPYVVTLDLSGINYRDGYVLMKTKHNVEIIVKIAEKDSSKTKEISNFLTETFLV